MKTFLKTVCCAVVLATASITVATPAQADDQSYLNYLEANGQSTTAPPYSPAAFIMIGQMICTNLRNGADPLAGASFSERAKWGQVATAAAQKELCPDTLS